MLDADVQRDVPSENKVVQGEVHAASLGDKPNGGTDADRANTLLHAGGLALEDESDL